MSKLMATYNETESGCWECDSHKPDTHGYPRAKIDGKAVRLHRFIYEEHFGPIPRGMVVRHKCDNRLCIRPDHLEIGTVADNNRDMVVRGRSTRGSRNPKAKLTDQDAIMVRSMPVREAMHKFAICRAQVYAIKAKRAWSHL